MHTDVLIIGAGLSGLHTAYEFQKRGVEYILLEARDRLGGRVLSWGAQESEYDPGLAAVDLGPSWFWPGQTRIKSLITELGLEKNIFFQQSEGDAVYEDNQGNIQRGVTGVSMAGAYRLKGGLSQLTYALSNQLKNENILLNSKVNTIKYTSDKIISTYINNDNSKKVSSNYVVIALPPRVAISNIEFKPEFSADRKQQLNQIATWMAGHAKLVCVYDEGFWRKRGFSGDVISHRGPLQEIHDASSDDGSLNALFGFVSIPAVNRRNRQDEIRKMAIAQIARIFGEQAMNPKFVYLQDWAMETYTSTYLDQEIQRFHPANNIGDASEKSWDDRLIWSGSEVADYKQNNNGFLEGALEASMYATSLYGSL
ncbi:MAG: FAD-dependent oxidoreductase [Gammaproteobacteria bacterium]|nr:FAD-dependent oxidoreductase [Gammaproteobacteria bacterium]